MFTDEIVHKMLLTHEKWVRSNENRLRLHWINYEREVDLKNLEMLEGARMIKAERLSFSDMKKRQKEKRGVL